MIKIFSSIALSFVLGLLIIGCVGYDQPTSDINTTKEAQAQEKLDEIPDTPPLQPTLVPTSTPTDNIDTCRLTGDELVLEGWSGKDTGTNWCNQCRCMKGGLACTKMACLPKKS